MALVSLSAPPERWLLETSWHIDSTVKRPSQARKELCWGNWRMLRINVCSIGCAGHSVLRWWINDEEEDGPVLLSLTALDSFCAFSACVRVCKCALQSWQNSWRTWIYDRASFISMSTLYREAGIIFLRICNNQRKVCLLMSEQILISIPQSINHQSGVTATAPHSLPNKISKSKQRCGFSKENAWNNSEVCAKRLHQ